ncbi:hypothetical protein [Muricauda sp. MAR_2010_75]|uniref:hypothetical protein n=1 Tax=Allomuricauda sp. MAR_2010_75 TaxID=1250232 RepID=UPI00056BDD4C|nr:hypothetical protein [Muricauda sp. MAR_2010_75]
MRLFYLFLALFTINFTSVKAQAKLEKGTIHDSIVITGVPSESFALYLPKSFSDNLPSSIVFIFEPAARGTIGIHPFIDASEKYRLILVCSNNSRNGPYERNFDVANRLFKEVFSRFNIKEDEIYASGFSGGSRLAAAIASLTNQFAGVVACGAGFSGLPEHTPSTHDFAYVGLCGYRDMNYSEMNLGKTYLNSINFNSTLFTFDDKHAWPPPHQITRAFDWLYLQKLKKETPINLEEIQAHFNADCQWLRNLDAQNELLLLEEQYIRLLKDYEGLIHLDSLEQEYQVLQKSKEFKSQKKALKAAMSTEGKWTQKLRSQFSKDFDSGDDPNFIWWEKELGKLDNLQEKGDVEMQKMVYRVKFELFARAYSKKNNLEPNLNENQLDNLNRFLEILYPNAN